MPQDAPPIARQGIAAARKQRIDSYSHDWKGMAMNIMDLLGGSGYSYGSGYGSSYGAVLNQAAAISIVSIIAFIAIIVLSVLGIVMYIAKKENRRTPIGRFFHFDHLFIENILKGFYLVCVVIITVSSVVTLINSTILTGAAGFLIGLLEAVLLFVIGQVLCRLAFEFSMAFVHLAVDARAIRTKIVGDPADDAPSSPFGTTERRDATGSMFDGRTASSPINAARTTPTPHVDRSNTASAAPVASAAPAPAGTQPVVAAQPAAAAQPATAPQPTAAAQPSAATGSVAAQPYPAPAHETAAPASVAQPAAWDCACGAKGNSGNFCAHCGSPRP